MRLNHYFIIGCTFLLISIFLLINTFENSNPGSEKGPVQKKHSNKMPATTADETSKSADETNTATSPLQASDETSQSSSTLIKSENEFVKLYPGNWLFKRVEKGRLSYITGGTISGKGRSPASIKSFVDEISPMLEVVPSQISEPNESVNTALTRAYHMNQVVDGFPVYQSSLSVHVRSSDDGIFMVNNQLKDVTGYNKEQRYTRSQAESYIQSHYAGEYEKIAFLQGPVIFKSDTVEPEMAWVFSVTFKTPKLYKVELVIGAYSGEEIFRQNSNIQ